MALENEPGRPVPSVGSWPDPGPGDQASRALRLAWSATTARQVRLQRWRMGPYWSIDGWRLPDAWLVIAEQGQWSLQVDNQCFAMRPGQVALVPATRRVVARYPSGGQRSGSVWGFHATFAAAWSLASWRGPLQRWRPWLSGAVGDPRLALHLLRQILCESVLSGALPLPDQPALPDRLRRAQDWLVAADCCPGVTAAAAAVGCTATHLRRLFRRHCGCSPQAWLREQRMARAGRLLLDRPDQGIAAIAAAVGYASATHFHAVFRRHYGQPPERWRRQGGMAGGGQQEQEAVG